MKKYMFGCTVTSQYGVRTLYLCSDKKVLKSFLDGKMFVGFAVGDITKSSRYFCIDGNTDIHTISLN